MILIDYYSTSGRSCIVDKRQLCCIIIIIDKIKECIEATRSKSFIGIILFFILFASFLAHGMIDQLEKQKLKQIGCYVAGYINTNKSLVAFYVSSCID